jgi:hypothetical protein
MFGFLSQNLDERMNEMIHKMNGKQFHPYKVHIVTLRSKQILRYLNKTMSIDEKQQQIDNYYAKMMPVISKCSNEFDPTFVYICNDELHFVFYYNDEGEFRYNGNIHKTMSSITSYVSIQVAKVFPEIDYFYYKTKVIEFDKDYESLNYLVWRQTNSTNNNFQIFYKCLYPNNDMTNLNTSEIHFELMKTKIDLLSFTNLYGVAVKRRLTSGFSFSSFDMTNDFDLVFKTYFEQKTIN